MAFVRENREAPEQTTTTADPAQSEHLRAEIQELRNMVIEKELELDALHQRLNCIIQSLEAFQVGAA